MEFFLSFRSFEGRKKVAEPFISGLASLSFHMKHRFPGTIISLSVPTEFLWQYISLVDYTLLWLCILISTKKDVEHISVNTIRTTFLLHK